MMQVSIEYFKSARVHSIVMKQVNIKCFKSARVHSILMMQVSIKYFKSARVDQEKIIGRSGQLRMLNFQHFIPFYPFFEKNNWRSKENNRILQELLLVKRIIGGLWDFLVSQVMVQILQCLRASCTRKPCDIIPDKFDPK